MPLSYGDFTVTPTTEVVFFIHLSIWKITYIDLFVSHIAGFKAWKFVLTSSTFSLKSSKKIQNHKQTQLKRQIIDSSLRRLLARNNLSIDISGSLEYPIIEFGNSLRGKRFRASWSRKMGREQNRLPRFSRLVALPLAWLGFQCSNFVKKNKRLLAV